MALVNKSFSVSVTPGMMPPVIHVSEYDIGRAYTVSIIDEQGNPFTIPSGTTASIEGTLNGSVGFTQSATISNNQVSFTLSESMTAYSGKAWCKIKLTQNSQPIQTCAFVLAVDRAGVEADTVIGAPGFEEQIQDAVDDYLDNHGGGVLPSGGQSGQALVSNGQGGAVWGVKPFALPSGGQSGEALLSDGNNGAYWGTVQSGGSGLTDAIKTALMNVVNHIGAWSDAHGVEYAQALYDALYPPAPAANLVSISASFNPGSHVVYDTDTLDSLKPYLTVTARFDNSTTQTVTGYTLSGTLTEGTRTITVSYTSGSITKTTTFNVTVVHAETGEVEMMPIVTHTNMYYCPLYSDGGETAYSDERFPTTNGRTMRSTRVFDNDTRVKITCAPSESVFQCFLFSSSLWDGTKQLELSDTEPPFYYCESSNNTFAYGWSSATHTFEYTVKAGYALTIIGISSAQAAMEVISVEVI